MSSCEVDNDLNRVPVGAPPFTVGSLRKAIPSHCFQRSLTLSSAYLAANLAAIAVLFALSTLIPQPTVPSRQACGALWVVYWFCQGALLTGVWTIAHECGHQAFCKSQTVNDAVGFVLHSLLLVPYYSWKHSHRRHHSNTASLDKDEVFVPPAKPDSDHPSPLRSIPERIARLALRVVLGWPLYLFLNTSGRHYEGWTKPLGPNHFDPNSPIFTKRERFEVAISDVALVTVLSGLYSLGQSFGWLWLIKVYIMPYLVVNHWLVVITMLQHTHPDLPHYSSRDWEWMKGALSTVDRSYGFLDVIFHHITNTHVLHHLFPTIPHYHAQEATEAIKPILGKYYKSDDRRVYQALWQDHDLCRYVAPDSAGSGIFWFRR